MTIKSTKYYLKDQDEGGAMPDTAEELSDALENRRGINEKALEGKVTLKYAEPSLISGETIILKGLGPRFSGQYIIEKHTISYSKGGGLTSALDLSRNAIGDTSNINSSGTTSGSDSPSEDATSGAGGSTEQQDPITLTRDEAVNFTQTGELPERATE
jgi:hypothetical protein